MCGIAGIILHPKGTETIKSSRILHYLRKMTDAISHRGPDGEGYWTNQNGFVGFGHRRLSIIDLSNAAAQPMHYVERYTIVYNGEIYNYIELKEELYKKGYRFQTRSDTEVILAAFDHWKEKCVQQLDGMFAFAIWDEKQQTLFAARDRFGEKPFYYYKDEEHFIFASEMKALWAVGVPKETDEKMMLNFITIGHVQNPENKSQTFFEDILSLPPAHYLVLSNHKIVIKRYWDIDHEFRIDISEKDAMEKFTSLLTTSVKRRLRSDVPIGTSLSGGLDSSTIISIVNNLKSTNHKVQTFSAVFPGFEKDESEYIRLISDQLKMENIFIKPSVDGFIKDFELLCKHQEEPFSSSSIYAQYKVYELASNHDVKVLLDGQGADETLAGYPRYCHWFLQQLLSRGKFSSLMHEKNSLRKNNVPLKWGIGNVLATYFPPHTAIRLERREFGKIVGHPDISNSFVASMRGREWEGIHKPTVTKLNDILYFNTMNMGLEELLRFADRNSMAHGSEVRLPFLNHELVEFVFSLPANYKIKDGWTKWILRKSMDKRLPDQITWRKDKVGYEPPQQQWLENPVLIEYIREAKKKLVTLGILKKHVLDKKIVALTAYQPNNYDWRYLITAQMLNPVSRNIS